MKVWCVSYIYRDERGATIRGDDGKPKRGWCATRSGKGFKEGTNNVPTKCGYFIILPGGLEKREPTCPDCVRALAN